MVLYHNCTADSAYLTTVQLLQRLQKPNCVSHICHISHHISS